MNQPPQTGKRIVSKGEYAKTQAMRVALVAFGLSLLALTICCGFATVLSVGVAPLCLILGGVTYLCGKTGVAFLLDAQELGEVQPITRANAADLPAPDSLVRASAEPTQEQEAVLLRAVTETQERHEEQLLRPREQSR